jgi:TM2 domain-containing membrane protein YozV
VFCSKCGSQNAEEAIYCEKCGAAMGVAAASASVGGGYVMQPAPAYAPAPQYQPQRQPVDPRMRGGATGGSVMYAYDKSPFLALFLSFLLPGVGQFYNGDTKRGFPMFLVGVFTIPLLAIPIIGWAIVVGVHIWSMINAYSVAAGKTALG